MKTTKEITEIEVDIKENILSYVMDPEIEIDIVNLGLVYNIDYDGDKTVTVLMTLSTPSCPLSDAIVADVEESIKQKYKDFEVVVELTFEPAWSTDLISEEGKEILGM